METANQTNCSPDLRPVAIDFETGIVLPDGTTKASTQYYRGDFRILSSAFTEEVDGKLTSWFVIGEDNVKAELIKLGQRPVIAYNVAFEMGCCRCRFPDLVLNWYCDPMRLVQNYDNGGDETNSFELVLPSLEEYQDKDSEEPLEPTKDYVGGFGLVAAVRRILKEPDHKEKAYKWIRENVPECKRNKEAQFLDRLPHDLLKEYNIGDTEATYKLYQYLTNAFTSLRYDWRLDHRLYFSTVSLVVGARIEGVPIAREALLENANKVAQEIAKIEADFYSKFQKEIKKVERHSLLSRIRKLKTLKGRKKYLKRWQVKTGKERDETTFNVGSNKQLEYLFVTVLSISPKFFTAKGSPSFKSAMLSQWGEGGLMLGNRRKLQLVLKQMCNLYAVSQYDGNWHLDMKLVGTASGRLAGGSN